MGFPAGPKPKPINLSSKPLKSFNWTKLAPAKVKDTIWSGIDDEDVHKVMKGNGYDEFEDLFAAKEMKAEQPSLADLQGSLLCSVSLVVVKDITFLDPKRSQNCSMFFVNFIILADIMLKAIKMDAKSIKKAINDVDTQTLPRHILGELLKFIPTDDELNSLKSVDSADIKNLAFAENFMHEISEIEKYGEKLQALYFKTCYGEYEDDADALIAWLHGASQDVAESKKFKELLKVSWINLCENSH